MSCLRTAIALIVFGLAFPDLGQTTNISSASLSAWLLANNGPTSRFVSNGHGETINPTVAIHVTSCSPSSPCVASRNGNGWSQNFAHSNSSKSFFHDGTWWAVLPGDLPGANGGWSVYKLAAAAASDTANAGWSLASGRLGNDNMRADIAWDPENEKLYVLQFSTASPNPRLYQLSYKHNAQTWITVFTADLGNALDSSYWGNNNHMALALDQHGNPMVLAVTSNLQGGAGLQVAFPTSASLDAWSFTTVDAETVNNGGGNGNSRADFVTFTQAGLNKIGILYSKDGPVGKTWNFAWKNAEINPSNYSSGWSIEVIADNVEIDDHVSASTDGETIYAAIKDGKGSIWLLQGQPTMWEKPLLIVNGGKLSPSRPIVVVDRKNRRVYVFFEVDRGKQNDGIHAKIMDMDKPVFDENGLGPKIMKSSNFIGGMSDPQGPVHAVGANTDGSFVLFAKDKNTGEVWYTILYLGAKMGLT